jgi:ribosomal protein L24
MDASNVMLLDANDKKPTRVGFSITSKQKIRVSRRSGAEIVRDTKGGTAK